MLDNAIVKGVFKWGIFIKQQQYAFLPVYHIIPFSGVESIIPRSFKSMKALKTVSRDTL